MDLNIVYLSDAVVGGWVTCTAHFVRGLRMMGHNATLYCLRKTSGYQGRFGYGVAFTAATGGDMIELPGQAPTIIIATSPPVYTLAMQMVRRGAILVVHDATEAMRIRQHWDLSQLPVIVMRQAVRRYFPNSCFVPHCYIRTVGQWTPWEQRQNLAISLARIDFDKRTEIILEANSGLPEELRVVLFGGENRVFSRKLQKRWPDLFRQGQTKRYSQHDPTTAVRTAAQYRFMVDMTAIHGDGGGTQYTFFEGADAGCVLVLNWKWVRYAGEFDFGYDDQPEMVPGVNCLAVSNGEELRQLFLDCHKRKDDPEFTQQMRKLLQGGEQLLHDHSPMVVIPKLISCVQAICAKNSS